jgi:hypothetical protein
MPMFSAAVAPTFAVTSFSFCQSELGHPQVVWLHRDCAIGLGARGSDLRADWDRRGSVDWSIRDRDNGRSRGRRSHWGPRDRGR